VTKSPYDEPTGPASFVRISFVRRGGQAFSSAGGGGGRSERVVIVALIAGSEIAYSLALTVRYVRARRPWPPVRPTRPPVRERLACIGRVQAGTT